MNGTYTNSCGGCDVVNVPNSGTASNYIVYINYPNHTPKLSFNSWNAFIIKNGVSYIKIIGFEIEGNNTNVTLANALNQGKSCNNPGGSYDPLYNGNGLSADGRSGNHPHHIVFAKNKVYNCGGAGISAIQSDYITIEDNLVYNNSWYTVFGTSGISIYQAWNFDTNTGIRTIIRKNKCYNNRLYVPWIGGPCAITDGNGIIIDDSRNTQNNSTLGVYNGRTLVENNVCWFNGGSGIHAFESDHVDIINNTAYLNSQSIQINGGQIFPSYSSDVKIINNILVSDSANKINTNFSVTAITYSNNLHYNITPAQTVTAALTNSTCIVNQNPLFIAPIHSLTANFKLQAASPAINAGNTATFSSKDYDDVLRPQGNASDIGAYEYVNTTAIQNTTISNYTIRVFPNPIKDVVVIASTNKALKTIEITNGIGQKMKSEVTTMDEISMDMSTFSCGLYYISISSANELYHFKVIKE
jgi:parallel beta-helix repeat protein